MQVILASQSPYRKAQLVSLGLSFSAQRPSVDEETLKRSGPGDLAELTRFLSRAKAQSLRSAFPEAILLGSDQIAEIGGVRLDKPGTKARAKEQLQRLQGKTHRLITSLVVSSPDREQVFTDITQITFRSLTDALIDAYLTVDEPYDCAGSYKIERAGITLVEKMESQDPSAIQGLPLMALTTALRNLNFDWTQLWRKK